VDHIIILFSAIRGCYKEEGGGWGGEGGAPSMSRVQTVCE